ncbi:polysaccharide pyruvyl transferase family protein [Paracoccus ravus]|uniref:polysaccharide pyruvyl transferase family protein n=1 Tax=Paracoccus ravus TaxID=2447760 RepID=UPI00106DF1FF|nr:polysaccharide pyruvyl transferase family protein [Paracoccus ravus]
MRLTYFRGDQPNFGDEINRFIWQRLLPPGFLDEDPSELFLGIGSIIWDHYPAKAIKHVIGSGYGGYTAVPDISDGTWNFAWVRGPLTAEKLGLDRSIALTDAAILLRAIDLPVATVNVGPAFMPHFESAARGNWSQVCARAGVTYLDPRTEPLELISRIRGANVLVTEAMHGAIVADALRTPFIAVTPTHPSHRYKWEDWAQSVEISLKQVQVMPSSLLESYVALTGLRGQGVRSRALLGNRLLSPLQDLVIARAAKMLSRIVEKVQPQLSKDAVIERVTEQSLYALNRFVSSRR